MEVCRFETFWQGPKNNFFAGYFHESWLTNFWRDHAPRKYPAKKVIFWPLPKCLNPATAAPSCPPSCLRFLDNPYTCHDPLTTTATARRHQRPVNALPPSGSPLVYWQYWNPGPGGVDWSPSGLHTLSIYSRHTLSMGCKHKPRVVFVLLFQSK